MKKAVTIILSLLLLVSCFTFTVSAKESGNLLANGDFDTGTAGWWMRSDWNGGTWLYSDNLGYEGTGCLVATGMGNGDTDKNAGLFYTTQEGQEAGFEFMAGEPYQLSFMCNKNDNDCDIYMDINEGKVAAGHAVSNTWEKVSFNFTGPSGKAKIRLVVNGLIEGGQIAVDNISLICLSGAQQPDAEAMGNLIEVDRTTQELGNNLLDNGNFNKLNIKKWWCRTDWNGGYFEYNPTDGVDGTGCLMAVGQGEGASYCNAGVFYTNKEGEEAYLTLESGKSYQLDADLMRPEGMTGMLYVDVNEGGGGSGMAIGNGEWEHVSFRFASDGEPIKLRVVANALKEGQNAYVDNISIREVGGIATEEEENENKVAEGTATIKSGKTEDTEKQAPDTAEPAVEKKGIDGKLIAFIAADVVLLAGIVTFIILAVKAKKK